MGWLMPLLIGINTGLHNQIIESKSEKTADDGSHHHEKNTTTEPRGGHFIRVWDHHCSTFDTL